MIIKHIVPHYIAATETTEEAYISKAADQECQALIREVETFRNNQEQLLYKLDKIKNAIEKENEEHLLDSLFKTINDKISSDENTDYNSNI